MFYERDFAIDTIGPTPHSDVTSTLPGIDITGSMLNSIDAPLQFHV